MPDVHNKYHGTAPPGAVYVGRPSEWGNPFSMEDGYSRDEAVDHFYDWVTEGGAWSERAQFRQKIRDELRGKDLVCFCKPKRCHADVLIIIANTEEGSSLGWGQYDGPGTEGYCKPFFSPYIPLDWDQEQRDEAQRIFLTYS